MKWVLVVITMSTINGSPPMINIEQFPTLGECFYTGQMIQKDVQEFSNEYLAKFSCRPSTNEKDPKCGLTNQESCK
jgi:hypothetical protein